MSRYAGVAAVLAGFVGALAALTAPDGDARAWWFRAVVAAIGVLAVRELLRWLDAQAGEDPNSVFRRPRHRRRASASAVTDPTERVLHLAEHSAGDVHRILRPLLQDIADERLRAHHGIDLVDPRAAQLVTLTTWELVRPDRAVPHDLRSEGLTRDRIDELLTDLEAL
jgi:hypothetical protein